MESGGEREEGGGEMMMMMMITIVTIMIILPYYTRIQIKAQIGSFTKTNLSLMTSTATVSAGDREIDRQRDRIRNTDDLFI